MSGNKILKKFVIAIIFALAPTVLIASPIYNCKDATGKATFQQTPCSADKLDSLADTQTSERFKRQETARQEKQRLIEEKQKQRKPRPQENRKQELDRQTIAETVRSKKEEGNLMLLKECVDGTSDFCEIDNIAYMITDMRMRALESVLGRGREQSINGKKTHYYPIRVKSGKYVLQVKYEINRTRTGEVGQVGNVVSEVNYY